MSDWLWWYAVVGAALSAWWLCLGLYGPAEKGPAWRLLLAAALTACLWPVSLAMCAYSLWREASRDPW